MRQNEISPKTGKQSHNFKKMSNTNSRKSLSIKPAEGEDIMKATGIVRRIDDLGRIVIPKEIRKTLKVKEGMPLEIYTDKEGGIILRKFLPFSEMSSLSEEFAQCVAQQMGNAVFVTDREKVVAAVGYTGEDIVGEPISHILENILDDRDERLPLSERNRFIPVIHGMEEHEQICQAIRSNGQIIGAIIIQAKDRKQRLGESEKKIALVAAEFLGKQVSV